MSTKQKTIYLSLSLALFILATGVLFVPSGPRIESSLPIEPFLGMESSGYKMYNHGLSGTISAAGQLFSPSSSTPMLYKLGFVFSFLGYEDVKRKDEIKFQIRLAEWLGDKPSSNDLWVSAPLNVPKDFKIGWVDFDVPHVKLDPKKRYIAWITLNELNNILGSMIVVKGYGPTFKSDQPENMLREEWLKTGHYRYPEGTHVLYNYANPNRNVTAMTKLPWEIGKLGFNLQFRMAFESKRESEGYFSDLKLYLLDLL